MKEKIQVFVESTIVQRSIISLIVINAVILGMETFKPLMQSYGTWLTLANGLILKVFVIELLLRLYVHRLRFFHPTLESV